jgi:hypothetical protein
VARNITRALLLWVVLAHLLLEFVDVNWRAVAVVSEQIHLHSRSSEESYEMVFFLGAHHLEGIHDTHHLLLVALQIHHDVAKLAGVDIRRGVDP